MPESRNGFSSMLRYKEAAIYVGFCLDHFRQLLKDKKGKKIPHYKVGDRLFFKTSDLDDWIEKHRKA